MPFNWRWLALLVLLNFKVPHLVVDLDQLPDEDYDVLPFLRTDSLPLSQSDGQILKDQSIFQMELDSAGEITRESTHALPMGIPHVNLDICPLQDICLASEGPSTGNASFQEIYVMKDSVSALQYMDVTRILLQAELYVGAYSEMINNILPLQWQPGSTFQQRALMVLFMTPALDVLMILFFIWRRLKSQTNQSTNKQLSEQFIQPMNIKSSTQNEKACVGGQQQRLQKMRQEREKLFKTGKERKRRIKSAELKQKIFKNTAQVEETALHQKLGQQEQAWREMMERTMENNSKFGQKVQETLGLLCKTDQLYQIHSHNFELKYRDSWKLASELRQKIEECKVKVLLIQKA